MSCDISFELVDTCCKVCKFEANFHVIYTCFQYTRAKEGKKLRIIIIVNILSFE